VPYTGSFEFYKCHGTAFESAPPSVSSSLAAASAPWHVSSSGPLLLSSCTHSGCEAPSGATFSPALLGVDGQPFADCTPALESTRVASGAPYEPAQVAAAFCSAPTDKSHPQNNS